MMDEYDSVRVKVQQIFTETVGPRSDALRGDQVALEVRDRLRIIYECEHGPELAAILSQHLSDWNSEAAFLVALHLFPELFSDDEIRAGIGLFLNHAPHHIRAACAITGRPVWEQFPNGHIAEHSELN